MNGRSVYQSSSRPRPAGTGPAPERMRPAGEIAKVDQLWRAYRRHRRQSLRALGWTLVLVIGRKLLCWDLRREPRLDHEIPTHSSGISFFVPVERGGVPLDADGRARGLPLQTRLIPVSDEGGLPARGARLSIALEGGPVLVLSIREAAGWRLRARFQERSGWRAARLGFWRLAPEGGVFRRIGQLMVASVMFLGNTLRPGRAFRITGRPADIRISDFYLAGLSPRQLSSRMFWPSLVMGLLLCPLLAGLLATVVLQGLGGSAATIAFGLSIAAAVAWTGGVACGSTVSLVAATVGAIPLTTALSILAGVLFEAGGGVGDLLEQLATQPLRDTALGGLPVLAQAPAWGVALVDAGLVVLSFAMAAARRPSIARKKKRKVRFGMIAAALTACAGPGLVAGLSVLLEHRLTGSWPLLVSLGLVGGTGFFACLALQAAARQRAAVAGGLYAAVCLVLPIILHGLQGTVAALLLVTAGIHVLLQGTFFALSYLLGERLGGVWMGAIVSSLQGAGGYTAFLLAMGAVAWP